MSEAQSNAPPEDAGFPDPSGMSRRGPCVSVLTPVYRAERFVQEAVRSALSQPETLEVVLVEDGSPDDSLAVCERLAAEDRRVKLFRHPNGDNRGEAASRNLALSKACGDYLAFLDADDYFLPGRFETALDIMRRRRDVDGVYEGVVTRVEEGNADETLPEGSITGVSEEVAPEELLEALIAGGRGYFCMGGIVLRRQVFDRVGRFDERLKLCPDTPMWWRIAALCRLVRGRCDRPVAVRRRHATNLLSKGAPGVWDARYRYSLSAYRWARERKLDSPRMRLFRRALTDAILDSAGSSGLSLRLRQLRRWAGAVAREPSLGFDSRIWGRALSCMLSGGGSKTGDSG